MCLTLLRVLFFLSIICLNFYVVCRDFCLVNPHCLILKKSSPSCYSWKRYIFGYLTIYLTDDVSEKRLCALNIISCSWYLIPGLNMIRFGNLLSKLIYRKTRTQNIYWVCTWWQALGRYKCWWVAIPQWYHQFNSEHFCSGNIYNILSS